VDGQAPEIWTVTLSRDELTLHLLAGRYESRFLVDAWRSEPACEGAGHDGWPHCVPNDRGTLSCVLQLR
jgi:hypothetical protein